MRPSRCSWVAVEVNVTVNGQVIQAVHEEMLMSQLRPVVFLHEDHTVRAVFERTPWIAVTVAGDKEPLGLAAGVLVEKRT